MQQVVALSRYQVRNLLGFGGLLLYDYLVVSADWGVLSLTAAVEAVQIVCFELLYLVHVAEIDCSAAHVNPFRVELVMSRWLLDVVPKFVGNRRP